MKIGGIYIKSISKRFWIVLIAFVAFIFIFSTVVCSGPKEAASRAEVANPPASSGGPLSDLGAEIAANPNNNQLVDNIMRPATKIRSIPSDGTCGLIKDLLSQPVTAPMQVYRLKVYIPDTADDQELQSFTRTDGQIENWEFRPALPILSNRTIEDLSGSAPEEITKAVSLSDGCKDQFGNGVVIGFPEGYTPSAGSIYEITGSLYTSNAALSGLIGDTEADAVKKNAPVLLADTEYRSVSPVEVSDEANYRAELNIPVVSGNYQLFLRYIDWPTSTSQPRLCASISNSWPTPRRNLVDAWTGFQQDASTLKVGNTTLFSGPGDSGSDTGNILTDPGSTGTSAPPLSASSSPVSAYVIFSSSAAGDTAPALDAPDSNDIYLEMPSLYSANVYDTSSTSNTTITIPKEAWNRVDTDSSQRRIQSFASCS